MKTAIVYYTLEGNTRFVVDRIKEKLEAELIEIETVKTYPVKGLAKFFHGGKDVVGNAKPELRPYSFDADKYDRIVLAGPVWAARYAAPFNTFLAEQKEALAKFKGNDIGIALCQSGSGADKAINQYRKFFGVEEFAATLVLNDPLKRKSDANLEAIDAFCEAFIEA